MNMFKVLLLIIVFSSIGCSSLTTAIKKNDTEKIISLLEKGKVDLNKLDYFGDTPLISAVRMGNIEAVKLLIEAGVDLDALPEEIAIDPWGRSINSYTALMVACFKGLSYNGSRDYFPFDVDQSVYTEIAKLLIEEGSDINVENTTGDNALTISTSSYGYEEMAILLIEEGVGKDAKSNKWDIALRKSAEMGYINAVKLLLENGVNIKGSNALVSAVAGARGYYDYNYNFEIINLFLEAGADINAKDSYGRTALMYACQFAGRVELIKLLLDSGADVNAKGVSGYTALYYAMRHNYNDEVIQLLIDYGAKYNVLITW